MRYQKIFAATLLSSTLLGAFPAFAQLSSVNFTDVPAEHWAARAVQALVEKYGVMEGFPDKTFRGTRNISRFEAAAALLKIMDQLAQTDELTKRIGKVALEDLKTIKALHEEFRQEVEAKLKQGGGDQSAKIKQLEEALEKLKEDIGSVRFGGMISVGAEDVQEDNFRPGYTTSFSLNMRIAASDKTTIRSALSGDFSSIQEENKDGENGKKSQFKESKDISVGFGEAWFDHREGGTLNPRVKFGFMGVTRLIQPFTSIPNQFGNSIIGTLDSPAVSRASPNLFGASRGIRLTRSFIAGTEFSEGIFSGAVAASPDVFYGQVKLDMGFAKLKFVSEGDQSLVIGEPVLDPLHNHTAILDLGNDNFGVGLQATFRGLSDELNFRGASGSTNFSFNGFSLGGSGKFESEKTYQQVIAGLYFSTPSNLKQINPEWADTNIPSVLLAIQSPFTLQNGELFEGSPDEVGDLAGFMIQVTYDNPVIPNLTVELGRRQKVFGQRLPQDSKFDKTTFALSSSFFF